MESVTVFISYAHADLSYHNELLPHLSPLVGKGYIRHWSDHRIHPGVGWNDTIKKNLQESDIILLLVSADFLSSDYINSYELPFAIQQHRQGKAVAVPVIVRECDWEETTLAELQALPQHEAKLLPVRGWTDRDKAYKEIVNGLKKVIQTVQQQKQGILSGNNGPVVRKENCQEPIKGSSVTRRKKRWIGIGASMLVLFIIVAVFVCSRPDRALSSSSSVSDKNALQVATVLLLASEKKERLNNVITDNVSTLISSEYNKKEANPEWYNIWTVSQIVVASKADSLRRIKDDYLNYIRRSKNFVPACHCWTELSTTPGFGNHVPTAWTMVALSNFNIKIDDTLLVYVLNAQNTAGWWSIYPSNLHEDASTQGTAFLALALSRTRKQITDPVILNKIDFAIKNATKWLESQRLASGLWYDYPNSEDRQISVGLNGLIVYVLNQIQLNKQILTDINQQWLARFDYHQTKLFDSSLGRYNVLAKTSSGRSITVGAQVVNDDVVNYELPWFIIANAEAFAYADAETQEKIRNFFYEIIDQSRDLFNLCLRSNSPWLAAEFLVSLRRINNEIVF